MLAATAALLSCLLLGGCHEKPSAQAVDGETVTRIEKPGPAKRPGEAALVLLTGEQIQKMGLVTLAAHAVEYSAQVEGYGTVAAHEAIASAVAELMAAQATARQSAAALARTRRLAATPGALSADVAESNERQAAVDTAALTLSKQRLSAILGQNPPWKDNDHLLRSLSDGTVKMLRVTFPLGALSGQIPHALRAAPIGNSARSWSVDSVWAAPADAALPGRSFFGLLRTSDVGEGERLLVSAPDGVPTSQVLVPTAAAVISDGKYWCYLEREPGRFARVELDASRPVAAGYAVTTGVSVGDKVVISGAGLLLAQESISGAEPE